MKKATFAVRTWRVLSVVFVLVLTLGCYVVFPDDVGVHFDALTQKPDVFLEKRVIFYVSAALALIVNTVFPAVGRLFASVDSRFLPIPNQQAWAASRSDLNEHFLNWFLCLNAAVNSILGLSLLALVSLNDVQFKFRVIDFRWLFYMAVAIFITIILALPLRLNRAPALSTD